MAAFRHFLKRFYIGNAGISSVEYALLLAFVAVGIVTAAGGLRDAVVGEMQSASCYISTGADCAE